jgi:DNA processing protein
VASLTESAALVLLLREGELPRQRYAEAVEEAGSALAVLEAEQGLFARERLPEVEAQIERWQRARMHLITVLDPAYPENLRGVHDRPPLIFVAGRLIDADARSVAIVGARRADARAQRAAATVAEHLVARRYTVVSGLAAGIDTAAHTAALAAGGRTVAVIGTGLARSYPQENAALQRRIAAECAVISQFWPDAPPSRASFPMRNAVMSGLALATVVVEALQTSGSRLQARLALAHGRPVFLRHTLLSQTWARELAERPGTHVVRSPQEITDVLERLSETDTLVG